MLKYRCLLLDASGEIFAQDELAGDDDLAAIKQAASLFVSQSFEIWQGARKVFVQARAIAQTVDVDQMVCPRTAIDVAASIIAST